MGAIRMQSGSLTNSPKMFFYNSKNQSTPTIKMTIDCDGKVGIGTTSPDHKLEIYESTGFVRLCMESSSTGKLLLGTHNDGRVFFE